MIAGPSIQRSARQMKTAARMTLAVMRFIKGVSPCPVTALRLLLLVAAMAAISPALAPAQEYAIGARDILRITVWGQPDLSKDYPVGEDGLVQFPLVGAVQAAGLTTTRLAESLRQLLEKDYLVDPQVLIAVAEYRSQKISVLGEADKPGLYYLTGPDRVLDILSRAGGLAKTAGTQLVLIRKKGEAGKAGETILRLSLDKVQAGDRSENILLQDDDTIFIPKAQAFFVLGEVKTPGTYPLDKALTVLDAVTVAGGFSDSAAPAGVRVIRRGAEGKEETFPVNLSGTLPEDRTFRIADGDTVMVPRGNTFFVVGEVTRPGAYQLVKETNVLEAIAIAGGFTPKAAPARTRVIRKTATGTADIPVDMTAIMKRGMREKAIRIVEHDVIVVPESFF